MKFSFSLLLKLAALGGLILSIGLVNARDSDDDNLPYVEIITVNDMASLALEAREKGKVIMLEMSASYCGYCKTLEEEIIKPMIRSGDYTENVLIRKINIDDYYSMDNINGEKTSPSQLARQFNVYVTPTLLFLDGEGSEVSKRILGVNSLDYYGYYVDEALLQGQLKLKKN